MSPLTPRVRAQLMEPYPECLAFSSVLQPGGLCNKAAAWERTQCSLNHICCDQEGEDT